jgi:hypothetical protein
MQITVQLRKDTQSRRREPATSESEELNRIIKQLGVVLEPMHPETTDADLSRYFTIEVRDRAMAEKVIDCLQQNKAVMAAYVKPPDAMP